MNQAFTCMTEAMVLRVGHEFQQANSRDAVW